MLEIDLNLADLADAYVIYPGGGFSLCQEPPPMAICGVNDPELVDSYLTPDSNRTLWVGRYSDALPVNPLASQFLGREVHGPVVIDRK